MCSLADIVHKDDVVDASSDFLTTLLVVVPKTQKDAWLAQYERLTPMVVPRSSTQLAQDEEYALYNVTLFKKVEQQFVQKAREHKFQVREFTYDEAQLERERRELEDVRTVRRRGGHRDGPRLCMNTRYARGCALSHAPS